VRLSKHTVWVSSFPRSDTHLLFSTRTQAQVLVDQSLHDTLLALPARGAGEPTDETLGKLAGMGLVVDDEVDEDRLLAEWFAKIRGAGTVLLPTVLTTYACNFACTYCIESGIASRQSMDDATAEASVEYIGRKAADLGMKSVFLTFYGGEPLLNIRALRIVAGGLQALCRSRGMPFKFGITTNGSLLTADLVDELKELGLSGVKVTIDGPREVHDQRRPYRSGKGSFATIMENVAAAVDKVDVDIGGNLDEANAASMVALLDELKAAGLASRLHRVIFKAVVEAPGGRRGQLPAADLGCAYASPRIMKWMIDLRQAAVERGFRTDQGIGIQRCDMLSMPERFLIDPAGILYACAGFVGIEEYSSGTIQAEGTDRLRGKELWQQCRDCPYVPLCGDGCPFSAYVRFGDPLRLNCQKEFVEYTVRESLKQGYLARRRQS
jgi:uncharacterized protein